MFPLKDNIPARHRPYVVWIIIALNALFFLYELGLERQELVRLFHILGVVPARFTNPGWAEWAGFPAGGVISVFTHMFLHSGWLHFLGNMWILWVFADNIEDIMGPVRFACFYILSGICALGVHFFFNMNSTMPVVGASGAIAGVMGAYMILFPYAKVVTLIPIFFIPYFIELPAVLFLGIWIFIQISSGVMYEVSQQAGGIAWWAHIGGFAAGILLLPLFKVDERCRYCFGKSRLE